MCASHFPNIQAGYKLHAVQQSGHLNTFTWGFTQGGRNHMEFVPYQCVLPNPDDNKPLEYTEAYSNYFEMTRGETIEEHHAKLRNLQLPGHCGSQIIEEG